MRRRRREGAAARVEWGQQWPGRLWTEWINKYIHLIFVLFIYIHINVLCRIFHSNKQFFFLILRLYSCAIVAKLCSVYLAANRNRSRWWLLLHRVILPEYSRAKRSEMLFKMCEWQKLSKYQPWLTWTHHLHQTVITCTTINTRGYEN